MSSAKWLDVVQWGGANYSSPSLLRIPFRILQAKIENREKPSGSVQAATVFDRVVFELDTPVRLDLREAPKWGGAGIFVSE